MPILGGFQFSTERKLGAFSSLKQPAWIEAADVWTELAKGTEAWAEIQEKNIKPFVLNEIKKKKKNHMLRPVSTTERSFRQGVTACHHEMPFVIKDMYAQNRSGRKTPPSSGSTPWEPSCICAQDLGKHWAANIQLKRLLLKAVTQTPPCPGTGASTRWKSTHRDTHAHERYPKSTQHISCIYHAVSQHHNTPTRKTGR